MNSRYHSFSSYLKKRFHEKVWKVTVDAGFTCPNRDGTKGNTGCIYCNDKGSGSGSKLPIQDQVRSQIRALESKGIKRYFVYFQAFSNTYGSVAFMKRTYDSALVDDRIVGLSIGTRPDCIDQEKVELIKKYNQKLDVWVELGLQSIHEKSLVFIGREHSLLDFEKSVILLKSEGIKVCVHLIFGLPGESHEEMLATVKYLVPLGVEAVKFHSLYMEKGTRLHTTYQERPFVFQTQEEYCRIVVDALKILPADIVIQRLTGDGDPHLTIAPDWALKKNETLGMIQALLERDNIYQGCASA